MMRPKRISVQITMILILISIICSLVLPARADWVVSAGGNGNSGTISNNRLLHLHIQNFIKQFLEVPDFGGLFFAAVFPVTFNPFIHAVVVNRRRRQ